jgi:Ca2+-binding RTX toxin-like protein
VRGSAFADTLTGSTARESLLGYDGDDDLFGGDGGPDVLVGGVGEDWLFGGNGGGSLRGDRGDDLLVGGDGDDSMAGGSGFNGFVAGAGNDQVSGGGEATAFLGAGDDRFTGGADDDVVVGGEGNDSISGEGDGDDLWDGRGDDLMFGGGDFDELRTSFGNDLLVGDDLGGPAQEDEFFIGLELEFAGLELDEDDRDFFLNDSFSNVSFTGEALGVKTIADFDVGLDEVFVFDDGDANAVFGAMDVNTNGFLDTGDTGIVSLRNVTVGGVEQESLVVDLAAYRQARFGSTVDGTEELIFYGIGENELTADDFGFVF